MDMLLVFLLAAGLSGGFVNGLAGFGTALFSLGWLLQVMPPQQAVAIALVCSLVTGVPGVWQVRHSIDRRSQHTEIISPCSTAIDIVLHHTTHTKPRHRWPNLIDHAKAHCDTTQ